MTVPTSAKSVRRDLSISLVLFLWFCCASQAAQLGLRGVELALLLGQLLADGVELTSLSLGLLRLLVVVDCKLLQSLQHLLHLLLRRFILRGDLGHLLGQVL